MNEIEVEILGSGGAYPTPRALCGCQNCCEATEKGVPFSRCGPSYFIHGPNILIDTPEEIRLQLTRARISSINACFYSHWHPDHTAGRRIFECNYDILKGMVPARTTPVFIPQQAAEDFKKFLGIWDALRFQESKGLISIQVVPDGESVEIGEVRVTPLALHDPGMYAFLVESKSGGRALIAPDELYKWRPPESLGRLDFAIIPVGLMDRDPLTGEQRLPAGFLEQIREMSFDDMLELVPLLPTDRVILSHIEEPEGYSFSDFSRLEQALRARGYPVTFAYDTQRIALGAVGR